MSDLESQNNSCEKKCESNDKERIYAEMRHLVDDAAHTKALCDLARRLSIEEGDAPDVRKMS